MPQPTPTKFSLQVNQILDCITLKVIFSVHFILLSIALTLLNWLPAIFLYYNTLFFVLLLWGNHLLNRSANHERNQSTTTSADVVLLAAVVSGTSIALDIICICTMYHLVSELSRFAASFVFIVLNLVLRPLTTFILTRLYYAKSTSKSGHVLPTTTNSGSGQPPSQLNSAIRKILLLDATSLAHSGQPPASVRESYREVHQQYQQQQQQPAHLQMSQQFSHHQQNQQQQQPHKRVSSLQLNRPVITLNTHHSSTLQQSSAQSAMTMSATAAPVVIPGPKPAADTISLASALSVSELSSMEPISITTPLPAPRQSSQSPTNSTTSASNHRQSTYIDPETGETFQERMI